MHSGDAMGTTNRKPSWGGAALVLGAALVFACGNTQKPGGTTSEAGVGNGGSEGDQLEPCGVESLAKLCGQSTCPGSPDDVKPFCGNQFSSATRSATACGGTVVSQNYGLGWDKYYFDETGKLVGVLIMSDVGHQCADGRASFVRQYGETCAVSGEPEDLCQGAPGCNQAEVCGTGGPSFRDCPADLDSFDDVHCDSALHYEMAASSCSAGTIVTVSDGVATVQYTFDEFGELAGTLATDDSSHRCWGMPCEPDGEVEVLCPGSGGAPATDAGGAGGLAAGGASGSP